MYKFSIGTAEFTIEMKCSKYENCHLITIYKKISNCKRKVHCRVNMEILKNILVCNPDVNIKKLIHKYNINILNGMLYFNNIEDGYRFIEYLHSIILAIQLEGRMKLVFNGVGDIIII